MADIKQAADWLKAGKRIKRKGWLHLAIEYSDSGFVIVQLFKGEYTGTHYRFTAGDLFSEDWMVAET